MITLKSGQLNPQTVHLLVNELSATASYQIKDIFSGKTEIHTGADLMSNGFLINLKGSGSTVVMVNAL